MSVPDAPCEHVRPGAWPFDVRLTLDEHLGIAEALVSCRHCHRGYLLEMLDWRPPHRVMRVAMLPPGRLEELIRELTRGSCDISRARAAAHHMRTMAVISRWLLLVDAGVPVVEAVAAVPGEVRIPSESWRTLACDGRWVDYLRSNTDTVNA
ncbi:MAG: hypothetical protein ACODAC_03715 [Pseudomonadota bacterium]